MQFNKLIPELSVSNIQRSEAFYKKILGFKKNYGRKESKFIFISRQGTQLMLEEENNHWNTSTLKQPFGRGINLQISTKNIDVLYQHIQKCRYPLFRTMTINRYRAGRNEFIVKEFLIQDPDGYLLRFAQGISSKNSD